MDNTTGCATCGGSGYLWDDVADSLGGHETEEWPCDGCGGTGTAGQHTRDEDCAPHIDPATDSCRICGVDHSQTCPECSGCGFHRAECPWMKEVA